MNERAHRRGKGDAEKKMRTQGRRDNPHCFMGIGYCEGGGKQKRKRSDWWLRMLCMGSEWEGVQRGKHRDRTLHRRY